MQVGSLYIDIDIETANLIESQRKINSSINNVEAGFNKLDKSANSLNTNLTKLATVVKGVIAATALRELAGMVQRYQEMAERVKMATTGQAEFERVQKRLLNTANGTYRSLSEAQELYIRTASALRSMGYTTDEAIDVQDSLSYAFVKNATSADSAESAISALTKSVNTGKVSADQWLTIITAVPTVIDDIAASSGKSSAQIRALGTAGKLTATELTEGLRSSLNANAEAAANMANNLTDAGVRFKTAITQLLSGIENQTGVLQAFTNGIISIADSILEFSSKSDNLKAVIDGISVAAIALASVVAGRLAASFITATQANLKFIATTYQAAGAQAVFNTALTAGKSILALFGGPSGVVTAAATAIFLLYQKTELAKKESIAFADSLNELTSSTNKLTTAQLNAAIAKTEQSIKAQEEAIKSLLDEQKRLEDEKGFIKLASNIRGAERAAKDLKRIEQELAIQAEKVEEAENKLSQTTSSLGILRAQLSGEYRTGIDLLKRDGREAGVTAGLMNQLGDAINFAARAKSNFNATSLFVERSEEGDKYLESLRQQNQLLSITDKRERAITEARQKALSTGVEAGSNQLRQIEEEAAKKFDLIKADNDRNSAQKSSAKSSDEAATALQRQNEEIARLSTGYKEGSLELAKYDAVMALGNKASQQQIQQAERNAEAQWRLNEAIRAQAAIAQLIPEAGEGVRYEQQTRDLKAALDAQIIDQQTFSQQSEKIEQEHQASLAKIRSGEVVTPKHAAAAEVDPVQRLANQHAQQIALIQQFERQGVLEHEQAIALKTAADKKYETERTNAQWELLSQQSLGYDMLTSAIDAFSGNASNAITGLLTGTMSATEAFRSLGNTILNSVINSLVQVGVEALKNYILGQTLGAASTAAAATQAGVVASAWAPAAALASLATLGTNSAAAIGAITGTVGVAQGLALAGARKNGGPVSAGSLYQVGEGGLPEIYRASTGKQYMIPGDNGRVISNKDMQSGGMNIQINITNAATGAQVSRQDAYEQNGTAVIDLLITDIERGGQFSGAMQSTFGLNRRANGSF
ncbi:tape measure protein [Entomohabitans teleogrylli]|uniref:tape measure protein n=1 Tax=Entomohabitans teleogrylli TaxID=1384589 RepID=UPI00073DA0BB|nr:tape measure protein [Entomohabitans teleogrylli]